MKVAAKKNKTLMICVCIIIALQQLYSFLIKNKRGFVSHTNCSFFRQCNSFNYFSLWVVINVFLSAQNESDLN